MASATISPKDVSELRARTGAGMMDCKRALEEAGGDMDKAAEILRKKGIAKAEKRAGRTASQGLVVQLHPPQRPGRRAVELNCETDFVARNEASSSSRATSRCTSRRPTRSGSAAEDVPAELIERERRIAEEQVAAEGKPEEIRAKIVDGKIKKFVAERTLLEQPFVRDDKKTVGELVKEASGKLGEAITVRRFARFQVGAA